MDRTPEKGQKYFQAIECQEIKIINNQRTTILIINVYIPPLEEKDMALATIIAFLQANSKCYK